MKLYSIVLLFLFSPFLLICQSKKMTPEVYELWNKIEDPQLSTHGNWASYLLTNEAGGSIGHIYNTRTGESFTFPRAKDLKLDIEEGFVAMSITASVDTIKAMKRRKVKKKKMPKDTLCIFDLKTKRIERIPDMKSYKLSNENPGSIAFLLAHKTTEQDSTLLKDEGKKNGAKLIVKHIASNKSKVFPYVKSYSWSEKNGLLAIHTTGEDSIRRDKILVYDTKKQRMKTILTEDGDYKNFTFNEDGSLLAFIADRDTTDATEAVHELLVYNMGGKSAQAAVSSGGGFIKNDWEINPHFKPYFIEGSNKIVFGTAPILAKKDSTLLDEEIVDLEIWHYKDGLLHTQQENNKKKDEKKAYLAIYDVDRKKAIQLTDLESPNTRLSKTTNTDYIIAYNNEKYQQYLSWEGRDYHDVFLINLNTGEKKLIGEKVASRPRISPSGEYATWFSRSDTAWYSQKVQTGEAFKMTSGTHYDELNDRPMHPWPSGTVAWSDNNESILYDYYDIWKLDITGKKAPHRLTKGRESKTRYRYIRLDKDVEVLPTDTTILVKQFNMEDKTSGYALLNLGTTKLEVLQEGKYDYSRRVIKAKKSDDILFTKQSFDLFPNLIHTDLSFSKQKTISNANPQQKKYGWGSIELYDWVDNDGIPRKALLAKPPNFNPAKKYPLIVNFYEKSSDRLYRHRAPYAHRSTINYTYYTNRGYVIFNPDVHYKDGYPGQSCYDAVMSSVDQLLEEGYIDEDNMGLQGHSWGGYQIAYLLTKTDRFKCAESGAPVVNMISAYGGIRWGSGMSRMFQYEKTQSRLGATLWERPDLYIHNSPVFELDKVETPVLILHNDKDGAVPWYQGIEYFVGLRRLGKPAWMLNYNDEPHWPVKKQNRLDFNRRMEQFFDYYLDGGKLPVWMKEGIPVIKKGVIDGFEYTGDR